MLGRIHDLVAAELGSIVPTPSGSARMLTAVCGQCQAVFCLSIKPEDLGLKKANLQQSVPGQVRPCHAYFLVAFS